MDFDDVADELYGLDPGEFVERRDQRAREARPGNRELAERIAALRRPSTAAFALNSFARSRREDLRQLLALGQQLRAAQDSLAGVELRALAAQRRDVVSALLADIRRLAHDRGHPLSDQVAAEVGQTLEAALADPQAGEQLWAGRLGTSLRHVGFAGGPTAQGAPAAHRPAAENRKPAGPSGEEGGGRSGRQGSGRDEDAVSRARRDRQQRLAEEVRRAEEEARRAEAESTAAVAAVEEARDKLDGCTRALEGAEQLVTQLEQQLRTATASRAGAERARRAARGELEAAERRRDEAGRRAERAGQELQRIRSV